MVVNTSGRNLEEEVLRPENRGCVLSVLRFWWQRGLHPDASLASTCILSGGLRFEPPVRPRHQMHRMQTYIFADVHLQ